MHVTLRRRSFGELLQLTFSLTATHFLPLLLITGCVLLPQLALSLAMGIDARPDRVEIVRKEDELRQLLAIGGSLLLNGILMPLAQGISMLLVAGSFTGKRVSVGDAFRTGLRKWPSLIAFGFAYGLLMMLGVLLLIVGMFVVMVTYYVGATAIVVEDTRWNRGLSRSSALTKGHRWTVFGLIVVVTLLTALVPGLVIGAVMAFTGTDIDARVLTTATWLISVIATTVATIAPVVVYFNLRVVKESLDVDQLAGLVDEIGQRSRNG